MLSPIKNKEEIMKNTIIIFAIIATFFLLYFLQVNFFSWFTIAGVQPNLFVILILFVGLFGGERIGIPIGILLGTCLDIFISKKIGISGIMLGIIGAIAAILDKSFSKDSRMTLILMTIGVTLIYELGAYLLNFMIASTSLEIVPFLKIVIIEIGYNVLLTILLYPVMQKAGYYLEDAFKSSQILTRYF